MHKKIIYFFLIILSAGCLISRKILFYPVGSSGFPQIRGKLITADNGRRKVYSYFTRGNNKLIVLFHGQHGTMSSFVPWAAAFSSLPAAEMALRKIGQRLILFAPYTSIPDVASFRYVRILPYLLIFDRFPTASKAENIKTKTLIFHCTGDNAVPFKMSEELQKKFSNVRLIKISGGNHAIFRFLNSDHWNEISRFIQ